MDFIALTLLFLYCIVLHIRIGTIQTKATAASLQESIRLSTKQSDLLALVDTLALQDMSLETRLDKVTTELDDLRSQLKTDGGL